MRLRLFSRPPAALVRIVGIRNYNRALREVWGLLQSRTFTLQLGYSLLQVLLGRLFPELQPRLAELWPPALRQQQPQQQPAGGQQAQKAPQQQPQPHQ